MVKIGSHLLEIINKNLEFQKNYIELELLDTKFSGFAKYISPKIIEIKDEVTGAELTATALLEAYNEQIDINTKQKAYEDEIAAYAATKGKTIIFERRSYGIDFKANIQAEQTATYLVLKELVLNELDIRKRMIITRKVLGDMAILETVATFTSFSTSVGENATFLAMHPSIKYIAVSNYTSKTIAYYTQGVPTYAYTDFKLQIYALDNSFIAGELIAEKIIISGSKTVGGENLPSAEVEFTPLGDYIMLTYPVTSADGVIQNGVRNKEILDFTEYGLALSPNWQGVTLDIIKGRG